jgi:FkbM family methyltransferase
MQFTVFDTNYKFVDSDNSEIPNYKWFVNYFQTGNWEPETFDVFQRFKDSNKTAIDIGAWIGPTSIWLSKNFKNVISFEPDKTALSSLKKNLFENKCCNVEVVNKAVCNNNQKDIFFGRNLFVSEGHGDSTSQTKLDQINEDDYKVETITFSKILKLSDDISFIKVDIEGGEESILEDIFTQLNQSNKVLWISFHLKWWKNQDINRFDHIINIPKQIWLQGRNIEKTDLLNTIKNNPMESFLFQF